MVYSLLRKSLTFACLVALHPAVTWAATDGSLGATSTGSVNVTITVPVKVQITKVANLNLGTYTGGGADLTANDNVCIYTNDNTVGLYRITATGDGAGSSFQLASAGNGTSIPYVVFWNDATGTAGNVQVSSGVALTAQSGANTSSTSCSGGNNANFQAQVSNSVLQANYSGTYTGRLTLLVEPN